MTAMSSKSAAGVHLVVVVAVAAASFLAALSPSSQPTLHVDAFAPSVPSSPAFHTSKFASPPPPSSSSSSALSMGKSTTMPGPASGGGGGGGGKSASDYRQKKMSDRLRKKNKKKNKNKKGGGFGGGGDDNEDGAKSGGSGGPIMEVELASEPDDGTEVMPLDSSSSDDGGDGGGDGFVVRLKDLGEVDGSDPAYELKDELGAEVRNFWLTGLADGESVKKTRNIVLRDAAKSANFPGFRKGQVPPYAQPKMTYFALQEVLVSSCQSAIAKFGVKDINVDQLGAVTFNEDVEVLSKVYDTNKCPSVPFTANFRAIYDPEVERPKSETTTAEAEGGVDAAEEAEKAAEEVA